MHRLSRLQIITEVSGPEPGYVATPIAMVQSALTVLEERPMIPSGVQTTASAFRGTSLISRLQVSCRGCPQLPQSNAMSFGGGGVHFGVFVRKPEFVHTLPAERWAVLFRAVSQEPLQGRCAILKNGAQLCCVFFGVFPPVCLWLQWFVEGCRRRQDLPSKLLCVF